MSRTSHTTETQKPTETQKKSLRRDRRAGLTILEMLIVASLFGLFMTAMFDTVLTGLRVTHTAGDRERIRQELVAVLDRMTREIAAAENVDDADDNRFQFDTVDVSNVEYDYASGALTHDDGDSSSRIVLRNITAFDFDYWDNTNTQLSTPVPGASEDTIRMVQVSITVTRNNETVTLAQAAFLRSIQ